jgi:hypothetical protein
MLTWPLAHHLLQQRLQRMLLLVLLGLVAAAPAVGPGMAAVVHGTWVMAAVLLVLVGCGEGVPLWQ